MEKLQTIHLETSITLEIKKSQFIAHLVPVAVFQTTLERLKGEHPKARHFVWGTRQLNEHQQIVENCTDDGEPRNTSGKPTLKVLQGYELINASIITIRYFGGIKLGTGGLVRAYNDAAQQVVMGAELILLSSLYRETIRISYPQMRHAEYLLKKSTLKVLKKDFDSVHVDLTLQGEQAEIADLFAQLKQE